MVKMRPFSGQYPYQDRDTNPSCRAQTSIDGHTCGPQGQAGPGIKKVASSI